MAPPTASSTSNSAATPAPTPAPSTKRECPITVAVRIRPPPDAFPFTHHCVQPSAHDPTRQVVVNFDAFADSSPGQGSSSSGAPRAFSFDHVFSPAADQEHVYTACVQPLLDQVVLGYNATVAAYGQTSSGKTFTMGTCPLSQLQSSPPSDNVESDYDADHGHTGGGNLPRLAGIAPRLVQELIQRLPDANQRLLRVSYIELYQEEVRDLLVDSSSPASLPASDPYSGTPSTTPISIREDRNGTIQLSGVAMLPCTTATDILTLLDRGSQARTTGETNMNLTSSRSHAIFSIFIEQYLLSPVTRLVECRESKLHLVDLAGSERQKRTLADGVRFKESIKINSGLLALGNVINALAAAGCDGGGHVPYRDSKLTRLLQDSLGGNSKTVLIACVSPMPGNAQESLNTLVYANRAKRIKNKPVVNTSTTAANSALTGTDPPAVVATPTEPQPPVAVPAVPGESATELLALVDQLKLGLTQANGMIAQLHAKAAAPLAFPQPPPPSSLNQLTPTVATDLAREIGLYLESSLPDPSRLTRLLAQHGVHVHLSARAPPQAAMAPLTRSVSTCLDALPPLPPAGTRPASVACKPLGSSGGAPPLRALSQTSAHPASSNGVRRATTAPNAGEPAALAGPAHVLLTRVADLEAEVAAQMRDLERLGVHAREARACAELKTRDAERAERRAKDAEDAAAYWERKAAEVVAEVEAAREEGRRVGVERDELKRRVREMEDELGQVRERQEAAEAQPQPGLEDELVRLTKEMEVKLAMIEELDASRKRTDHLSQKFRDKMVKLERELHSAEKQVDRLKSEKLEMDSEKNRLKHEYELKIQQVSAQLTALRGRQKQHDKLVRERETKQRQINELQTEVDKLRDRQAQLQAKVRAEADRLASAQAVHLAAMQKLERQHEEDQRKIKVLEGQVVALRKRVDSAASVSSSKGASGQVQAASSGNERGGELGQQQQQQQERVAELETIVTRLQQDRAELEDQVKDLEHYRLSNKELRVQLRALMATAAAGASSSGGESHPHENHHRHHHRHRQPSHHHHQQEHLEERKSPADEILAAAVVPLVAGDEHSSHGHARQGSGTGTPLSRIRLSKRQLKRMAMAMSATSAAIALEGEDQQGRSPVGMEVQVMEERRHMVA